MRPLSLGKKRTELIEVIRISKMISDFHLYSKTVSDSSKRVSVHTILGVCIHGVHARALEIKRQSHACRHIQSGSDVLDMSCLQNLCHMNTRS